MNKHSNTLQTVLHFMVRDMQVCADLKNIDKVLPMASLITMPDVPSYVAGFINIEGEHVPVIDSILKLGFEREKNYGLDTPILVLSLGHQKIALIVDEVLGLLDVDQKMIQKQLSQNETSAFSGTYVIDTKSYLMMNINYWFYLSEIKGNYEHEH